MPMTMAGDLSGIYGLLSSMYLCKPSKEAVGDWRALLREIASPFLNGLREALDGIHPDSEREMEDLLWDYTKLFIGPYKLPCPPWESVYTSPKRLMMQEAYDAVSDLYRQAGLSIGDPNVLQDHVGAELSFLAVLYGKMETVPESAHDYRELAERLLGDHLRKWIPAFSLDLERSTDSQFYKALARATRGMIAAG
jgi:TorA maturation chaperone TorD